RDADDGERAGLSGHDGERDGPPGYVAVCQEVGAEGALTIAEAQAEPCDAQQVENDGEHVDEVKLHWAGGSPRSRLLLELVSPRVDLRGWQRTLLRGQVFEEVVVEVRAALVGRYRQALIAAMRTFISSFEGDAGDLIRGHTRGHGVDAVGGTIRHGRHDRSAGPHASNDLIESAHHLGVHRGGGKGLPVCPL